MKKNEKIVIGVLVVITVILIIVAVCVNKNESEESTTNTSSSTSSTKTSTSSSNEDEENKTSEYVVTLEDGTKLNTSSKLNETKTIGGIEISDIQLTSSDNVTQILATMTNTSDETEGGYIAVLTLYDEDGNVLIEMKPYIEELEPGETAQLNTSAVFDYTEAYDFTIEKQ